MNKPVYIFLAYCIIVLCRLYVLVEASLQHLNFEKNCIKFQLLQNYIFNAQDKLYKLDKYYSWLKSDIFLILVITGACISKE